MTPKTTIRTIQIPKDEPTQKSATTKSMGNVQVTYLSVKPVYVSAATLLNGRNKKIRTTMMGVFFIEIKLPQSRLIVLIYIILVHKCLYFM